MCVGGSTPDLPTPAQPIADVVKEPTKLKIESNTPTQQQKQNKARLKVQGATGLNTNQNGGTGLKL